MAAKRTIGADLARLEAGLRTDAANYGLDVRSPGLVLTDRAKDAARIVAKIPAVFAALEDIKEHRITSVEKATADLCIAAVKRLLGDAE